MFFGYLILISELLGEGVLFTKLRTFGWYAGFDSSTELSLFVKVGLARCTALRFIKIVVNVNNTSNFKEHFFSYWKLKPAEFIVATLCCCV